MRGFNKFKQIIEKKNISKNFENFVTSHMNSKNKNNLKQLNNIENMIDKQLTSLPFKLDEIIFKEKELNEREDDYDKNDKDDKDDNDNDNDGMMMPIPILGVKY